MRRRREADAALRAHADAELLSIGRFDSSTLRTVTMPALRQLQALIGHTRFGQMDGTGLVCTVLPTPGDETIIDCPEGRLGLVGIAVEVGRRG